MTVTLPPYRPCGECAACCVWLGIESLKKWPGQTCKHLDGSILDKRCTVYDQRPACCVHLLLARGGQALACLTAIDQTSAGSW